jgi:hypothetical protein
MHRWFIIIQHTDYTLLPLDTDVDPGAKGPAAKLAKPWHTNCQRVVTRYRDLLKTKAKAAVDMRVDLCMSSINVKLLNRCVFALTL